jgi:hypothetical protein
MITISGIVKDGFESPVHCLVTVTSKSTPLSEAGGAVTAATLTKLKTDKDTGEFELILHAGVYEIKYGATPTTTECLFEITVPTGTDTVTIDEVTSSELTFTGTAPNTLWNERLPLDKTLAINGEVSIVANSGSPALKYRYNGTDYLITASGPGGFSGTANRAMTTNGSGNLAVSAVTATELLLLSGVTGTLATQSYVTTAIANLVASAPGALDTLNELAAALGNDASFATTVATNIAAKVAKAGDTMTGALIMADGSSTVPSLKWHAENTGFYWVSTGHIGMVFSGTYRLDFYSGGIKPNANGSCSLGDSSTQFSEIHGQQIFGGGGSAGSPGYTFDGDTNTGLYRSAADEVSIACGGAQKFIIAAAVITSPLPIVFSGTGHGGIKLNNLTTTQRDALTGAEGMLIANTTTHELNYRHNSSWVAITPPLTTVCAGLSTATFAVITSSDTILGALGKLQAQISNAKVTVIYTAGEYPVDCSLSNCFQMTASDGDDGPINITNIQEGRPVLLRVITDDPTGVISAIQYDGESTVVFFASGSGLPTLAAWDYVYTLVRFGGSIYVAMADFNTV